ncbi:MAG: AAA family ATPase [Bacteroidales bacterium]|nr:AAA family ATPase [Bacteroidales bacterium]
MYIRPYYTVVRERLLEPKNKMQVIAGPRQVGKSTLVEQVCRSLELPSFIFNADAIPADDNDWIRRVWESVRIQVRNQSLSEAILVIDEIQKLKQWSEVVKREWDADIRNKVPIKVLLLGSSRLLLRKGLTESLAGRYELIRMGHWSYPEMRDAFGFTLEQWIYFGGYPGAADYIADMRRWKKYIKDSLVAPAIEKDVIMTANIYKPALMKQLFELGCSYSSEQISLTKLLGQLQDAGNVTTLSSYLEVLGQCNLLTGLHKYAFDEARKRQSIPKILTYNNALMTAYRGKGLERDMADPMVWGRWIESAVGAYLLDFAEEQDAHVYYWRDRNDEVDFIVECQGDVVAIEVKSGRRGMNSGLPEFVRRYHPHRSFVAGTDGIPFETFFQMDLTTLFE